MRRVNLFNENIKQCNDGISTSKIYYHGSYTEIRNPKLLDPRFGKDFGQGFYITEFKEHAERWTRKFRKRIISSYKIKDLNNLKIKSFKETNDEWLEYIANCRYIKDYKHGYDMVEGPMADDQVYDWVSEYKGGRLSKEMFFKLCEYRYPTHQIAICSEKALEKLEFMESYEVK